MSKKTKKEAEMAKLAAASVRGNAAVLPCGCAHEYQDTRYGKGKRLHNAKLKSGSFCCTVCNTTKG